jgi:hypothetical protein
MSAAPQDRGAGARLLADENLDGLDFCGQSAHKQQARFYPTMPTREYPKQCVSQDDRRLVPAIINPVQLRCSGGRGIFGRLIPPPAPIRAILRSRGSPPAQSADEHRVPKRIPALPRAPNPIKQAEQHDLWFQPREPLKQSLTALC